MIRAPKAAPLTCQTTPAHVTAVSARFALPVTTAGGWLFCVRKLPRFGQSIVYKVRVSS